MTINYYLDRPRSTGETAIYLFLRIGKQTVKLKTGQYIQPALWNPKPDKNGHHVRRTYSGCVEFNGWLDALRKNVHRRYNELTTEGQAVTLQELREAVLAVIERRAPQTNTAGFLDHFQSYIDAKATTVAPGTVQNSKGVKKHLQDFSAASKYRLAFETINLEFFDKFKAYLVQEKRHTSNTVWKTFATLKAFLNWALDRELHQNLAYRKFRAPQTDGDTTYLTHKELMTLYHADLSDKPKLGQVRDVFCFGCFTGQRFSDIAALKRSDIRGDKWFLKTIKTDKTNQVPLNGYALTILSRYKDQDRPLPVLSNQKTNEHLKVDMLHLTGGI